MKNTEVIKEVQDRRVKRTQSLLARALIALTLEKGYEAVTIRDITDRADVGYATFFRHYHHKDALLHEVLDVVLAELIDLLHPTSPDCDPVMTGTLIFRYVEVHGEVIRVLLSSHSSSSLAQHMLAGATESVLSNNIPLPNGPIPIEIAANHLVTSSIALIHWWLEHQMPYPPEEMGIIYNELIVRPTATVSFQP